ncbi:MAG: TRAM domain-containing protein [Kiritimatiellia bacterium]|jgi:23S rRNA (uracil1939-C5)-methyltransferase|nr:TRAM domain-containing protein [Kiritimatiellia bacterium]
MIVGQTLTCTIESLAYGGDGVARADGLVVFVPQTLPGEEVRVRITQRKKSFARAEPLDILTASPRRIAPGCRVTDPDTGRPARVPGCVYDHLDYAAEQEAKQRQLDGFLRRLPQSASGTAECLPGVASPAALHYRNKIVLHAQRAPGGGLRLGYRQEPSHRVLDLEACPLADEAINATLAAFRHTPEAQRLREGDHVTFRSTPHHGVFCWQTVETPFPPLPEDGLLAEDSPVGVLRVPADGFYQVNPAVGDALVRTVAEWFAAENADGDVLDLYCGVGVFGLACMRAGARSLTGIESGRRAVAAARLNAAALDIPATFLCRALGHGEVTPQALAATPSRVTCILDPPRDGLQPEVTRALASCGFGRILYAACDPATLTRDLAGLCAGGYVIRRVQLFDMFPRTARFETLAELRLPVGPG